MHPPTTPLIADAEPLEPLDPHVQRLRLAFDLFEAGVAMERLRLRRCHPDLADAAIEDLLVAWLRRDGEPGDAEGRVVPWPRVRS